MRKIQNAAQRSAEGKIVSKGVRTPRLLSGPGIFNLQQDVVLVENRDVLGD